MINLPILNTNQMYPVAPTKIIALGKNYLAHIAERAVLKVGSFDDQIPAEPILFSKTPNVLVGPDEPIVLPAFIHECGFDNVETHYEAELAFVIAKRCRNVPAADAQDVILGYTCMNDVSQRNIQSADKSGWFRGKSLDTFGPIGPCLVCPRDIGDAQDLGIRCRINGRTVQDGNTRDMIFPIPEIVAFVSKNFTLEPGDIILTGTPAGVGPLAHGDTVEVQIDGIGILRNPVIDERF